jgi:hypothetical protein
MNLSAVGLEPDYYAHVRRAYLWAFYSAICIAENGDLWGSPTLLISADNGAIPVFIL